MATMKDDTAMIMVMTINGHIHAHNDDNAADVANNNYDDDYNEEMAKDDYN